MKAIFKYILIISFTYSCELPAQENFEGAYTAQLEGTTMLYLDLKKQDENYYTGTLKDEYQTYSVEVQTSETCLEGNAREGNLQINLKLSGCFQNGVLELALDFSDLGVDTVKQVTFSRNTASDHFQSSENNRTLQTLGNRDAAVSGIWKQEQIYNSGYGDNFFGGSFTQQVIFYPDGGIADGGSQTTMSGSDYLGNSTSARGAVVPGVSWSTKDKHLFITATQNGQTQTVDIGKYYVENGKMLITSSNGAKTLLIKIQ